MPDFTTKKLPRNAKLLLFGLFVSSVGNGMHLIALGKALYDLTGSLTPFAAILAFDYIITLFCQAFIGPLVDRKNPKTICVLTDFLRGGFLLGVGAILLSYNNIWIYFSMVVFLKFASQFYRTAIFALIGTAINNQSQVRYAGLANIFLQIGQIVGVIAVGILLLVSTPQIVFIVDGFTYLVAAVATLAVTFKPNILTRPSNQVKSSAMKEWWQFVKELRRRGSLWAHILISCGDMISVSFVNLSLVPIVALRHHDNGIFLSIFDGSFAVGAITASLMLSKLCKERILPVYTISQSISFFILALSENAIVSAASFAVIGFANAASLAIIFGRLQQRTNPSEKGKISSFRNITLSIISMLALAIVSSWHQVSLSAGLTASGSMILFFAISTIAFQSKLGYGNYLLRTTR